MMMTVMMIAATIVKKEKMRMTMMALGRRDDVMNGFCSRAEHCQSRRDDDYDIHMCILFLNIC